jgi:5-hydroxyisourate hydrolase
MSALTTHVLDNALGAPAREVAVRLEYFHQGAWTVLAERQTDHDGRVNDLLPEGKPPALGTYRLTFGIADYFHRLGMMTFYTEVPVLFVIRDPERHHHVPLLVSPYGYSTYRGS